MRREKKIMKETQEKKNKNILNILIVLLLITTIVVSSIGLYAWSRYTSLDAGEATAQVAKWHFELTDGEKETSGVIDFPITRTDNNKTVADEKLAPGTSGQFEIGIDATGTETFLEYELEIALTGKPTNLKFYEGIDDNLKRPLDVIDNKMTITGFMSFNEEMKRTETIYWDWPYETKGKNEETDKNDEIDTKEAGTTMTMRITATGTEVLEPTIVQGEYLDLGKDLVGTTSTADDWRIFYEDEEEGMVYAILADYLPVDVEHSENKKIVESTEKLYTNDRKYSVNSNTNGKNSGLIGGLKDTEHWKELLAEELQSNNKIKVTGGIDVETWVKSWNKKCKTPLYTCGNDTEGYCIGTSNPPTNSYECQVSLDPEYNDTLYFPHTRSYEECWGYWLASQSAKGSANVMFVECSGKVYSLTIGALTSGVLPAVCLPSDILQKEGNTWKVIEK